MINIYLLYIHLFNVCSRFCMLTTVETSLVCILVLYAHNCWNKPVVHTCVVCSQLLKHAWCAYLCCMLTTIETCLVCILVVVCSQLLKHAWCAYLCCMLRTVKTSLVCMLVLYAHNCWNMPGVHTCVVCSQLLYYILYNKLYLIPK